MKENCFKLRLWNGFKCSKVEKEVKMFVSVPLIFYLFVSLFQRTISYLKSLNSLSTIVVVDILCWFSVWPNHLSSSVSFHLVSFFRFDIVKWVHFVILLQLLAILMLFYLWWKWMMVPNIRVRTFTKVLQLEKNAAHYRH